MGKRFKALDLKDGKTHGIAEGKRCGYWRMWPKTEEWFPWEQWVRKETGSLNREWGDEPIKYFVEDETFS